MAWKDKQNAVEELTHKMNENIKNFKKDPKEELELLKYISQFNNYSIKNISLIRSQRSGAWGVASYKQFKEKGYQVQRGEKAIKILAPKFQDMFRYKEEGQIKTKPVSQATKKQKQEIKEGKHKVIKGKITNFIAVPVFDITQTDCPTEDYPVLYPNKPENFNFKGTEKDLKRFHQAVSDYAKSQNVKVNYDVVDGTAKGFYAPSLNEIVVDKHLNEKEKTKVLLHELAHAEMHNSKIMKDKAPELRAVNVLEYQAEMTAYIVSSKFELDTEDYSTHYLASWTKREVDDDVYLKSLEEVKEVSSKFIDKIVENYSKLEKIKEQENTPLQQIDSLKAEIKERDLDKAYADSFEQSAQIREDIERKEEKIYNLIKDNGLEDDPALDINDLPMTVSDKLKENNPANIFAKKSGIISENDNFGEIYKQNLKANSISVEDKEDYQKVFVEVKDENKKSHILNIVTEDITKEKLDKYTEGMTGKEWLQEDIKTSIIENDENKSLFYPADKINKAEFTPIDDVKQSLDKAHTQSSPAR